MKNRTLRQLPSVNKIVNSYGLADYLNKLDKKIATRVVQKVLNTLRNDLMDNKSNLPSISEISNLVINEIVDLLHPTIKHCINLTGTILHTNLGRSLLPQKSIEAMIEVANSNVNLEYDFNTGARGDRNIHLEKLIYYLTGATNCTAVNNNAAAVLLSLNTLAENKEVIVSRGELIEIGGSFRLPDIMKKSHCKLVEVGTTNRTHARDYEKAITPNTGLILKVHTSNYKLVGFTSEVPLNELVAIGIKHKIPVMVDLGSGALVDYSRFGLPKEPTVQEIIKTNVDIVTFSGDKLLGSIQAGLILGKDKYITKIQNNPLKRALRLGKIEMAALSSTLRLYLSPETLPVTLPTLFWISRPIKEIEIIANEALDLFKMKYPHLFDVIVKDDFSEVGSGSLPEAKLPTKVLVFTNKKGTSTQLSKLFRMNSPPILGRIQGGKFILDMRMVTDINSIIPNSL